MLVCSRAGVDVLAAVWLAEGRWWQGQGRLQEEGRVQVRARLHHCRDRLHPRCGRFRELPARIEPRNPLRDRYLRGELLANAEAGADGGLPGEQEKYLKERIKVGGKAGNLGDVITISTDKSKITIVVSALIYPLSDPIYPSPPPQLLSDPALCAAA